MEIININQKNKFNWQLRRRIAFHARDVRIMPKIQAKKAKLKYKIRNNLNIIPYKAKIYRMRNGTLADLEYILLIHNIDKKL